MRTVLITLLLALATSTTSAIANANTVPSAQDRATVADAIDRSCHAVQYAEIMKDAAASGEIVAPELQDSKRIRVDEVRARMKGSPETARFDRQVVAGCNCAMKRWKKMAHASRTWADIKAINVALSTEGLTPEAIAYNKACFTKASSDTR